jgi:hypothetical protein
VGYTIQRIKPISVLKVQVPLGIKQKLDLLEKSRGGLAIVAMRKLLRGSFCECKAFLRVCGILKIFSEILKLFKRFRFFLKTFSEKLRLF